ncbi:MAG TPA: Gfo/Idh/MocA family oxidoreductase [Pseudonocardiaceae bacterium]|nr:Gfo/Idh/MocA family oxidoreductase [Pseudonocardiaceae bacterium]
MAELRIGVLGCAEIARRRALPAFLARPGVRLVAVASRDGVKAASFAAEFGCAAVTGYQALLDRADVDAVYLPLPPALHVPWAREALLAGKHVLAEKPLATEVAEATELVELAASRGLVLMENFAFLHHPQLALVRKLIDDGEIGELRGITAEFGFPPVEPTSIRYQPELGGGALLDAGVYPLRTARVFLGADINVLGASLRLDPASGVDVGGAALVVDADGVTGQLAFGFDRAYRCTYTLWGSKGRLIADRAFSAPPGFQPPVRLERQSGTKELAAPAAAQFETIIARFAELALGAQTSLAEPGIGADVVAQARLLGDVRAAARQAR